MNPDNITVKGNTILWTLSEKKWIINTHELTKAYLTEKHPFTGTSISPILLEKIKKIIKTMAGEWWIVKLDKIKSYKHLPLNILEKVSSTSKKLGSGKYASVYDYNNYAVKIADHKYYDDIPRVDGMIEAKIYKELWKQIISTCISPNIGVLYQYTPSKKMDYLVFEKMDNTVWHYLNTNPEEAIIKNIIVQVMHCLLTLQTVIPGFRHNDIKVDNILLDKTPRKGIITLRYKDNFWFIPENIPIVKVADFDFSALKNIKNPKVGTSYSKTFGCTIAPNKIYDVHLFLNSMYSYKKKLTLEMKKWIMAQLPTGTRGSENTNVHYGRLINPLKWVQKINDPLGVLNSKFLKEYKNEKPKYPVWGIE
jgi:hypothetical protein